MIETPIFVTSIFHEILNDIDVTKLSSIVEEIKQNSTSYNRSSVSGFQSNYYIDCYDNEIVKNLFENHIIPKATNIMKYFWGFSRSHKSIEYWYNVNEQFSYNTQHNHIGSLLSGVFYIKTPENCGNINFVRNDAEVNDISKFIDPNNTTHYTHCRYWSKAVEGKLVMFPSYLPHYVEQNMSNENRICLSFNFMQ